MLIELFNSKKMHIQSNMVCFGKKSSLIYEGNKKILGFLWEPSVQIAIPVLNPLEKSYFDFVEILSLFLNIERKFDLLEYQKNHLQFEFNSEEISFEIQNFAEYQWVFGH